MEAAQKKRTGDGGLFGGFGGGDVRINLFFSCIVMLKSAFWVWNL